MNDTPISDSEVIYQSLCHLATILDNFPDLEPSIMGNLLATREGLRMLEKSAVNREYHGHGGTIGLRDTFAGQILLAFYSGLADPDDAHRCPLIAYYWADRMLEARKLDPKAELDKLNTPPVPDESEPASEKPRSISLGPPQKSYPDPPFPND